MADWIKMRSSLVTNPRVLRMARVLLQDPEFVAWFWSGRDVTRDESVTKRDVPVVTRVVVGALLPVWSMVNDTAGRDGVVRHASSQEIDDAAGVPGFGRALQAVEWLEELPGGEGVRFINFEEHNSPQKERSLTSKSGAERTKEYRERKKKAQHADPGCDTVRDGERDVTVTSQRDDREEKKREEKKSTPKAPKGAVSARFEEFWLAWPKSERKQDKAKCLGKWAAHGLDSLADTILADVRAKRGTAKWQERKPNGGDFIESPEVYLNNRRWEDGNAEPAEQLQETFV